MDVAQCLMGVARIEEFHGGMVRNAASRPTDRPVATDVHAMRELDGVGPQARQTALLP